MNFVDALNVCFSTVAVLFLYGIDNIADDHGLSEEARMRVEERGRVDLGAAEAAALVRTKAVHVGLIVLLVTCLVWSENIFVAVYLPLPAFWLGGVAEAVGAGGGAAAMCKGVGKATGALVLGLVGFFILLAASGNGA